MKRILLFLILFFSTYADAQEQSRYLRNTIYGSFGRQALIHVKYERNFITNKWANTFANVGLGIMPVEEFPDIKVITPEIGQMFSVKNFHLELGVEPAILFDGATYVDLNAIIGLRFQQLDYYGDGIMVQIGYNPRIINSSHGVSQIPFYAGIGMSF